MPWVFGGEYDQFAALIERTVDAWLSIGIQPAFVFDGELYRFPVSKITGSSALPGPSEPVKFPTQVSRVTTSNIYNGQLFFRTSTASRNTPRFLAESRILPPLCYTTCVQTLLRLHKLHPTVTLYFADREADAFAVALAGRLGAYVIAQDSDFVVLNSAGYLGYIPLDDMQWSTEPAGMTARQQQQQQQQQQQGDDFVPVVKRGLSKRSSTSPRGVVPPDGYVSLSVAVYTPTLLAKSLKMTVTLLPLVGAIVGNDYGSSHQPYLFDRKLTPVQRITHTTTTLASILHKLDRPTRKAGTKAPKNVLDLIRTTVNQMLVRPSATASGEIDRIVDGIVESALQYAIPPSEVAGLWPTPNCPIHDAPEQCRIPALVYPDLSDDEGAHEGERGGDGEVPERAQARHLYLQEYRAGMFDPQLLGIVTTATAWPRVFLEDPDAETAAKAIGRPLRMWTYAILDEALGIPLIEEEEEEEGEEAADREDEEGDKTLFNLAVRSTDAGSATGGSVTGRTESLTGLEDEDEDAIIDVIDEDSEGEDPLEALKGALNRLRGTTRRGGLPPIPDREEEDDWGTEGEKDPPRQSVVQEYVRRGARLAPEPIPVLGMAALFEQQKLAWPPSVPHTSTHRPLRLEAQDERLTVLLYAAASYVDTVRALDPSHLFPVLVCRWLVRTAGLKDGSTALLARWRRSDVWALLDAFGVGEQTDGLDSGPEEAAFEIDTRSVQLMSRALAAIEALKMLVQALGLTPRVPFNVCTFRGSSFHLALASGKLSEPTTGLREAVEDGLEQYFGDEPRKREKKKKKQRTDPKPVQTVGKTGPNASRSGMFSVLADLDNRLT